MKNTPLKTAFYLLAPCIALGGFAIFLTRRAEKEARLAAQAAARQALISAPLNIKITGVESQPLTPIHLFQGYDRHFAIVFDISGGQPLWWQKPVNNHSATTMRNWTFWLERNGKRTPFKPTRVQLQSSDWDKTKKRYFNSVFLQVGDIPSQSVLKMKGQTRFRLADGSYTSVVFPVEATLKRANETWSSPPISTNPLLAIQKIQISPPHKGQTEARITLLRTPGFDEAITLSGTTFLNQNWQPLPPGVLFQDTFSNNFRPTAKAASVIPLAWSADAIKQSRARTILLKCQFKLKGSWPLDITFPIKQNGKPLEGSVPSLIPAIKSVPVLGVSPGEALFFQNLIERNRRNGIKPSTNIAPSANATRSPTGSAAPSTVPRPQPGPLPVPGR